jgi:hypothetical protein
MISQCSLRLDLIPGDSTLSWQIFDRLTGGNGGMVRTLPVPHPVDPVKLIESFNDDVVRALNSSNVQQSIALLRAWGCNVCKSLFPDEIIHKLSMYESGDILFIVPVQWADVPFEIICMSSYFLGERFQVGTIISTGISQGPEKQHNHNGDLLIIADPSERLQSVSREGEGLRSFAVGKRRQVRLLMQADAEKLTTEIPVASMVHFAGHSGLDSNLVADGWKLSDGTFFTNGNICKVASSPLLPWLIFSNSCDGGRVSVDKGLSGIAGAFLSAGVHQVVGPFCKLNDLQAGQCTVSFYNYLFKGKSVAYALMSLRKKMPQGAGLTPLFYRLFGDPRYNERIFKKLQTKAISWIIVLTLSLILFITGLNWLHNKITYVPTVSVSGDSWKIDRTGKIIVDLNIAGIIRLSVNMFAPAFTYDELTANQKAKQHGNDEENFNDTMKSNVIIDK